MIGSEDMSVPQGGGENQQVQHHDTDDDAVTNSRNDRGVAPDDVDAKGHDDGEHDEVRHGHSGGSEWSVHRLLISLAVTVTCVILCLRLLPVVLFFTQTLFLAFVVLVVTIDHLNPRSEMARALERFGAGRLIAMLAALALFPPLSPDATVAVIRHPWWLIVPHASPDLRLAVAFALLSAVQCAVAMVLMLDAIPPAAVYGSGRRVAAMLPAEIAIGLGRWIDKAEHHYHEKRSRRPARRRAAP